MADLEVVVKLIEISMEWNTKGAAVTSTIEITCPTCGTTVTPNVQHLCGDKAPAAKVVKARKAAKRRKPKA